MVMMVMMIMMMVMMIMMLMLMLMMMMMIVMMMMMDSECGTTSGLDGTSCEVTMSVFFCNLVLTNQES